MMFDTYDGVMLWAAMTGAHFGLLRAAEITVISTYDHEIHLSLYSVSFHVNEVGTKYLKSI